MLKLLSSVRDFEETIYKIVDGEVVQALFINEEGEGELVDKSTANLFYKSDCEDNDTVWKASP